MGKTETIRARVEPGLKRGAEAVLRDAGYTMLVMNAENEADQHFVSKALPDSVRSLVNALPALRTREGLVVGEGCSVPVRILFDEIPIALRPRSSNVPFAESWKNIDATEAQVTEAVRRWREQDRS